MKNLFKLIDFIILAFAAVVCIAGCSKSPNSAEAKSTNIAEAQTINSAQALKEYLDKQPANTPDNPIRVTMNASTPMLPSILAAITYSGKYVSLNLSGSALTSIPDEAFCYGYKDGYIKGCTLLTAITIPNRVTSIGQSAFYGCTNLASVTIGNRVTSIGQSAFYGCTNLTAINVDSGNTRFSSDQGILYNKDKTTLIQYPGGKTGAFTIPNSVKIIGGSAFNGCTSLASVTIPNSVASIGDGAFNHCTSLASVTIGNSVTTIGDAAFQGCRSLTSVTIPDSVTSIGARAFFDSSLTNVTFEGNGVKIGLYAFVTGEATSGWNYMNDNLAEVYSRGGAGLYQRKNDQWSPWTKQ